MVKCQMLAFKCSILYAQKLLIINEFYPIMSALLETEERRNRETKEWVFVWDASMEVCFKFLT